MVKGLVFNIQKFSLHDGPGIRTLLFFKGCPLRCLWCDNPESQPIMPELVYYQTRCIQSQSCIQACPEKALSAVMRNGQIIGVEIDRSLCNLCGACVKECVAKAWQFVGEWVTPEAALAEIEKDLPFYGNSGGLTLSGGEPFLQPDFARHLLELCHERGIHTAVETCGYWSWDTVEAILPALDLLMLDIKQMDPQKHKAYTGVSNERILANAQGLAKHGISMIVRLPVIPGFTDSERNIRDTAAFVAGLGTVQRIDLAPYHKLGVHKYAGLGRKYSIPLVEPPSQDKLRRFVEIIQSYGVPVQIGG
jgi:pyruvate formate lyase activating enzyme